MSDHAGPEGQMYSEQSAPWYPVLHTHTPYGLHSPCPLHRFGHLPDAPGTSRASTSRTNAQPRGRERCAAAARIAVAASSSPYNSCPEPSKPSLRGGQSSARLLSAPRPFWGVGAGAVGKKGGQAVSTPAGGLHATLISEMT